MLLLILSMFPAVERSVLYLEEKVVTTIDGQTTHQYSRSVYLGKQRVRIDFPDSGQRLIYNMDLKTLYVIDLAKKRYFLARPNTFKERSSRKPLYWIAEHVDNRLERGGPILRKTGRSAQIEGYTCYEYEVTAIKDQPVKTTIWATRYLKLMDRGQIKADKKSIRQVWMAALGIEPPLDVKQVIRKIFDELEGLPIRTVSTIMHDDIPITTTSTIVGIERAVFDDKFFSIPPNFQIIRPKDDIEDRPWSDNDRP
ncbi:MAG: hypothetical protein QNK37_13120 [Acidobacteriota bacterium]|nr:hypothetical protein [Acidobacteriota bacterium]